MEAPLPAQLAVVVVVNVEGLMGVFDIVREGGREQDRVAVGIRLPALEALHGAPQIAELLHRPPREEAIALDSRHAELLDRRVVRARQGRERIRTVLVDAEIDEVIRIVVESHDAPQVRIVAAQNQLVAVQLRRTA